MTEEKKEMESDNSYNELVAYIKAQDEYKCNLIGQLTTELHYSRRGQEAPFFYTLCDAYFEVKNLHAVADNLIEELTDILGAIRDFMREKISDESLDIEAHSTQLRLDALKGRFEHLLSVRTNKFDHRAQWVPNDSHSYDEEAGTWTYRADNDGEPNDENP